MLSDAGLVDVLVDALLGVTGTIGSDGGDTTVEMGVAIGDVIVVVKVDETVDAGETAELNADEHGTAIAVGAFVGLLFFRGLCFVCIVPIDLAGAPFAGLNCCCLRTGAGGIGSFVIVNSVVVSPETFVVSDRIFSGATNCDCDILVTVVPSDFSLIGSIVSEFFEFTRSVSCDAFPAIFIEILSAADV